MKISGATKVCGIIGDPVGHSLSPVMHNAAFERLRLDFIYVAFTVRKEELAKAMNGVRSLGVHGLNVTMPHKNAIVTYVDELDQTAEFINAVNTVLNRDGKLIGFNTDGVGALEALSENGLDPKNKKLLLLGAGGAANAIAFQTAHEVNELVILNRTPQKARKLAESLNKKFGKKATAKSLSAENVEEEIQNSDILVNATSVGMHPSINQSPVAPELLRPDLCVMDIVYNPLETRLAREAKKKGARVISGVEMLIYQGAASFEIWTGHRAPVNVMREAVLKTLAEKGASR